MSDGQSAAERGQAPYGYCPHCGAKGVNRERRIDGKDTCENGHVYPSRSSVLTKPKSPELPTLGRIVHITWPDGAVSPAIVTRTKKGTNYTLPKQRGVFGTVPPDRWGNKPVPEDEMADDAVDVQVFGLVNTYPLYNVQFGNGPKTCHWHWPERG